LLWNVGINHRVGPSRVFVDLARALAEKGFTSLRFDISGLGDSEVSRDARPEYERAADDVRQAMQALRARREIHEFVLVGFCSSVDAAHVVGVAEPSVVGVMYLEGYTFRTIGFYARYWRRYFNVSRWERGLRQRLPTYVSALRRATSSGSDEPEGSPRARKKGGQVYVRDYPTPEKFRSDIRSMLSRGTKLLFVYVGRDTRYVYRDQLYDVIGRPEPRAALTLEYYEDTDHTFFHEKDRARVVRRVVAWMSESFAKRTASREAAIDHGAPRPEEPAR
jgi:pimeloyl-ACP methyl ester carboxylesterase